MPPSNPFDSLRQGLVGQRLAGRFELRELIGSGAVGDVYQALDVETGALRAVKVIDCGRQGDVQLEARFRREAQALRRLQHESIVQLFDFAHLSGETYYLVMEYVDGPTLDEVVELGGPLPVIDALGLLLQTAGAVAHAHEQGVVHRDLKPANLILPGGDPRSVKVVDLGLVKLVADEPGTALTTDQQILGTPLFMAPEQCTQGEVGPPADVYALGCLGYYLLTGRPPFAMSAAVALVLAHLRSIPERVRALAPGAAVPVQLDALLWDCLDKRPELRPTARDVEGELAEIRREVRSDPEAVKRSRIGAYPGPQELLAHRIWREPGDEEDEDAAEPDLHTAVRNNLTNLILELAEKGAQGERFREALGRPLERVQAAQRALGDVEMALLLLEDDASAEASGHRERAQALRRTIRAGYRDLYVALARSREAMVEPGLRAGFAELDGLIQAHGRLRGRGVRR